MTSLSLSGYVGGFLGVSMVKNLPINAGDAGDVGSVPGLGRSPGGGNGNPLQYFCLEWLQTIGLQRVRHKWMTEHACKLCKSSVPTFPHLCMGSARHTVGVVNVKQLRRLTVGETILNICF